MNKEDLHTILLASKLYHAILLGSHTISQIISGVLVYVRITISPYPPLFKVQQHWQHAAQGTVYSTLKITKTVIFMSCKADHKFAKKSHLALVMCISPFFLPITAISITRNQQSPPLSNLEQPITTSSMLHMQRVILVQHRLPTHSN
jgi:hypothetical protein